MTVSVIETELKKNHHESKHADIPFQREQTMVLPSALHSFILKIVTISRMSQNVLNSVQKHTSHMYDGNIKTHRITETSRVQYADVK